ncbi:hypothetical protein, partial [Brevibacterium sediminis]|uniref:hypothetical protein n=1 Tax=Brevibacterium sediminis TaxID=1857024 RepID=UPI003B3ACEA6
MHTEDGTHAAFFANEVMQRAHFVCEALEQCADPNNYFQLAASSLLVPPAALSEVVEAVEAYQSEPTLALKAVVPSLRRAERAITMSLAVSLGHGNPEVVNYRSLAQGAVSRQGNHGALTAYLKNINETLTAAAGRAAADYNEKNAYLLEL